MTIISSTDILLITLITQDRKHPKLVYFPLSSSCPLEIVVGDDFSARAEALGQGQGATPHEDRGVRERIECERGSPRLL